MRFPEICSRRMKVDELLPVSCEHVAAGLSSSHWLSPRDLGMTNQFVSSSWCVCGGHPGPWMLLPDLQCTARHQRSLEPVLKHVTADVRRRELLSTRGMRGSKCCDVASLSVQVCSQQALLRSGLDPGACKSGTNS